MQRKTKTSTEVKNRYKKKTYKRYTLQVRMDSELYIKLEEFLTENPGTLNGVITDLLQKKFEIIQKTP